MRDSDLLFINLFGIFYSCAVNLEGQKDKDKSNDSLSVIYEGNDFHSEDACKQTRGMVSNKKRQLEAVVLQVEGAHIKQCYVSYSKFKLK